MGRFALVLVALWLLVSLGVALVVGRALAGIDEHHRLNHRLLAQRVIDELERELGSLITREEERSFAMYRYFVIPGDLAPGSLALARSPLVTAPRPGWILGYYQREPDGSLRSPAVPADAAVARELFGYRSDEAALAFLERAADWFEPGTRTPDLDLDAGGPRVEVLAPDDQAPVQAALNRGASARGQRDAKAYKVAPSSASNYQATPEAAQVQQQVLALAQGESEELVLRGAQASVRAALPAAVDEVDVRVEPFSGRLVSPEVLLLERRVQLGGEIYRQGLALDPRGMLEAVAARVLRDGELRSYLALHPLIAGHEAPPPPRLRFSFAYRFAQPFADLGLRIDLAEVPGERPPGGAWLLGLGLGIIAVVAGSLLAVGRMVATRVAYARRRADFVSAVTHELKTPLTSIRMYGEMLGGDLGADDAKRARFARVITAEGERLSRLIDNVLELGRLERDDRPLTISEADPRQLLSGAIEICRPHAEHHGFTLEVDHGDGRDRDLPDCRCDRDALTQVLVNLIDNAVKFAAGTAASPRIVLAAHARDDRVVLSVRDFGPGIPPSQLDRVCEPFYRGERELTRRTAGTGLGLALARSLVRGMGGRLVLSNPPDGGLQAEIHLPTN